MSRAGRAALAVVCLASATARADAPPGPVVVSAVAIDPADAAHAVLVGPGGQVYLPQPHDAGWRRAAAGGLAAGAAAVALVDHELIAAGPAAVFRWHDGAWLAMPLPQKGAVVLGTGPAVAAAVGTAIFARGRAGDAWTRIATAPQAPTALWASATDTWILADGAAWRLRGKTFVRGPAARALVPGRRPLAIEPDGRGLIELADGSRIGATDSIISACAGAHRGEAWMLVPFAHDVILEHGVAGKPPARPTPPGTWTLVWTDDAGNVALTAPRGEVAVWRGNGWSITQVDPALPSHASGPGPATSH